MNRESKETIWRQFGAAVDMLEGAIRATPEDLWGDRTRTPEVWYLAYHALFWLDLYLSGPVEGFRPPEPFGLEELDPAGVLPPRVYSRDELLTYLEHGRRKCRSTIDSLTEARATERHRFAWGEASFAELLLYNMRHVQHHAAQINLILRQTTDSAPRWVAKAGSGEPAG
jgi:hypothetical protein